MSEEQRPAKTPEEIREIMQSDKFMNDAHNMLLQMLEASQEGMTLLDYMETLTFDNLTPEIWATISAGVPVLRGIVWTMQEQVKASAAVFGDEEAIGVITRMASEIEAGE